MAVAMFNFATFNFQHPKECLLLVNEGIAGTTPIYRRVEVENQEIGTPDT